jgi:DNA repair exonuclease SbcCD ATPase subunit
MKISALRLFNVKRFADRGVAIEGIGDGVNVLCAANEFGKSTSFEALHALFFQPYSSTSGDIRNLRPYSGGNPLIEVDISTEEGRFRITKQYYSGRSARVTDLATGRLLVQADEAENFISGLVKGGTAGPAGLLWVRQGVTGIERRSKSEEDGEREVRRSLLESVQGEVETVTGGRRMAEIMGATQEALAERVTATGRPKAGGRYAAAIEDRDRLIAEEQRLSSEVTALREALEKRASATKRLTELDSPEQRHERKRAIETAQMAFDAAKAQSEKLKTAEAEMKLACEQRDTARQQSTEFRAVLEKAKELQEKVAVALRDRDEAIRQRREAGDAAAKARADAENAERDEKEARDLLARLDAAMKAREAAERLAEMKDRLNEAEATRRAIEDGEARHVRIQIPSSAIDELQALEVDIAKLRALEEAARSSVSIDYRPDAAGLVTMDDAPLSNGEVRTYANEAHLSVPGVGTITLRSNRSADQKGLAPAEAKRHLLLASMGVDDLSAAWTRQVNAQEIHAELRELQGRLSQLAPEGLPALREQVAELDLIGSELLELKEDPAQVRAALAEAEAQREVARQLLQEIEPVRANVDNKFIAAETTLASLRASQKHMEAILGPNDTRSERGQALSSKLNELNQQVAEAEALVGTLRMATGDLETVGAQLRRVRSVDEAAESEANILRQTIAELNGGIRTKSEDAIEETWRETAEARVAASVLVEGFEKEVAVLQRLAFALETARTKARDLYLKPVMNELTPLLRLLFDDVSITFDDKTLLPQAIRRNGQDEDVDRLSGGMREQLSVLTRLAFARLLAHDGRPAPVILDDALVYSDDDRIEKMFDALHRQSRDQQIIVFSCRQRAFQKLGGTVLQMTEWQP